jgi:hypothetical protein
MSDVAMITLARALKVKNRLAGLVSKLDGEIKTYNSAQQGAEHHDVREFYRRRKAIVSHLVALKSAITLANAPVQAVIYELAELKALIALLNSLDTKHGTFVEGYSAAQSVGYVAHLRRGDVNDEVLRLQSQIDRMQDQLDTFNHTTRIAVPAETMAIADGKAPPTEDQPPGTA